MVIVLRLVGVRRVEVTGFGVGHGRTVAAAWAAGLVVSRYKLSAYVSAALLYCAAGVLLAGVVSTPSAFQGDSYLLPSVAAVVLQPSADGAPGTRETIAEPARRSVQ